MKYLRELTPVIKDTTGSPSPSTSLHAVYLPMNCPRGRLQVRFSPNFWYTLFNATVELELQF